MLLAATAQYGSPEWLSDLRIVLVLCWVGVAIVAAMQWNAERPDKPKPTQRPGQTAAFCKLHQRPEHLCRDMHE
jgi:hypothetical protein